MAESDPRPPAQASVPNPTAPWRHSLRQLRELPVLLIAWLVAWPLGRIFPRNPARVAVIGRDDGRFRDNTKYFFIHGLGRGRAAPVFVTGSRDTRDRLREHGAEAVVYPSLAAFRLLLSAGTVVADSWEWGRGGRYQLAAGATRVQLWHGVPLKEIEQATRDARLARLPALPRLLYRAYLALFARYPRYDLFVSTSAHFTRVAFARSFDAARVVDHGYPRNDVLDSARPIPPLACVDCDGAIMARLREEKARGRRILLYAPTYRVRGANPVGGAVLDYVVLQEFAARNDLFIVLKLHPYLAGGTRLEALPNIVEYDAACDIYPALPLVDLLVTDYSSIYFDFLLVDRPIVFFPYDLEDYMRQDRSLFFDYEKMTPGPIARTQEDLLHAIGTVLADGGDGHGAERARVRKLAFDHPAGGAAERIWSLLERPA